MSTRANIILKQGKNKLYFYRHSDGYPEGVFDTLKKFINLVNDGKIRNNILQAAGWLVLIGAEEYGVSANIEENFVKEDVYGMSWKSSSYELTNNIHGDIEYLYVIDFDETPIKCFCVEENKIQDWFFHYKEHLLFS